MTNGVKKENLDAYINKIATIIGGFVSSGNLTKDNRSINEIFGDSWGLFFSDDEKMNPLEFSEFLRKVYSGPLWSNRSGSLAQSGAYHNLFYTGTIDSSESPNIIGGGSGGYVIWDYKDSKNIALQRSEIKNEYQQINPDFTISLKDFFTYIGPKEIKGEIARKTLLKISESGLLDLLFYKPKIQNFAKKRYVSKDALEKSALEYADEYGEDLDWLAALTRTYNSIIKDPISAWLMSKYFPNLAQFVFSTIASTADYSNNGFGGSKKDPLNDPIEMAKRMFKAFGTDTNGDAIFKPAWTLINTAMRIEAALAEFPFRNNIPPRPPDIFHLRLGAANFYVPPVTININSMFKTGSLTGRSNKTKEYSKV